MADLVVPRAECQSPRGAGYFANSRDRIPERLELERVAGRIVEKHRRLLAHLAREADAGLDLEAGARPAQPLGQRLPCLPFQDDAEMRHGNILPIHFVVMHVRLAARIEMRHQLVAEEIEVDPLFAAAALGAAEQAAIEVARGAQRDGPGWRDETVAAWVYLPSIPPFVTCAHRQVRLVREESADARVEQRVDFPAQISRAAASPAVRRSGGRNSFSARSVQTCTPSPAARARRARPVACTWPFANCTTIHLCGPMASA